MSIIWWASIGCFSLFFLSGAYVNFLFNLLFFSLTRHILLQISVIWSNKNRYKDKSGTYYYEIFHLPKPFYTKFPPYRSVRGCLYVEGKEESDWLCKLVSIYDLIHTHSLKFYKSVKPWFNIYVWRTYYIIPLKVLQIYIW